MFGTRKYQNNLQILTTQVSQGLLWDTVSMTMRLPTFTVFSTLQAGQQTASDTSNEADSRQ
jgi:hypothetical protein